ncbi:hypothetical protein pqer_cds_1014 [Pandoravirus quercus]|uniref:Uncharacterized protein n=1 Tax=Pandoravirus quercus TaxID=2107709 RepID=A0A2U7UAI7_9VIRU|nr:hypothetical protein pqer_cds_1014 [Pandoravirus quercus]AVK75436.1 hypothetical protein pqer_cds_1014 [Pandoravirus quercus]
MDAQQPTKEAVALEGSTETASASRASAESLLAEALACVAWDGTVDTDRLASIEFAHDEAAARRVVALAARLMDSRMRAGIMIFPSDGITIGGVDVVEGWDVPFVAVRHDGAWRVEALGATVTMTDERLALYCALCARGARFSMTWQVRTDDMKRAGHDSTSPVDAGWCLDWRSMWMSRVVRALTAASGAWTGDEVMRTQSLARALLAVLEARNAKGPLADLDGSNKARPTTPSDAVASTRIAEAMLVATGMSRDIEFSSATDSTIMMGMTLDAVHAVETLHMIINSAQRVYETQSLYTQMILPAEYDALQRNTPNGAFK